jgi:hypothetical protein
MDARVDSASDDRTANNAVRHQYRVLGDAEKALMVQVKDAGAAFIKLLHTIGGTDPMSERQGSRDLALAQTHAEDAVMRAGIIGDRPRFLDLE